MNSKTSAKRMVVALVALLASPFALGAGLGDEFDPYVTPDEINAMSGDTMRGWTSDGDNPYVLREEITTTDTCTPGLAARLGDEFDQYVTMAEIEQARTEKRC